MRKDLFHKIWYQIKYKTFITKRIHRLIAWYLEKRCGGSCHTRPYGPEGRYIVIMSDKEYHDFQWNVRK